MLKRLLVILSVLALSATAAFAETVSVSTAKVKLRAGPGSSYPSLVVIPAGSRVVTHGCVTGYAWCDISYETYRGWVSARYVKVVYKGAPVALTGAVAPAVGVSVVVYDRTYWDTYYTAYPWHRSWTTYYRAPVSTSTTYVGPNAGTASRTTGCVGSQCGTQGMATGANGGTATGARGCGPNGCGAAGTITGPDGNTASGARGCGPRGCGAAVQGPRGNTVTRRVPR